jgi:hypothetical protein
VEPKVRDFVGAGLVALILVALVVALYLAAMQGAA